MAMVAIETPLSTTSLKKFKTVTEDHSMAGVIVLCGMRIETLIRAESKFRTRWDFFIILLAIVICAILPI